MSLINCKEKHCWVKIGFNWPLQNHFDHLVFSDACTVTELVDNKTVMRTSKEGEDCVPKEFNQAIHSIILIVLMLKKDDNG